MAGNERIEQYKTLIKQLFPKGRAWALEGDSNLAKLLGAVAIEFCRIDDSFRFFLKDAFPDVTTKLLTDWERVAGIPDECTTLGQSIDTRQKILVQKLTTRGGQNAAFFELIATQLGFTVEVTPYFEQFLAGRNRAGDRITNDPWRHWFRVTGPATIYEVFKAGVNRAGDRLVEIGNETLECTINKRKPAHSRVQFIFEV